MSSLREQIEEDIRETESDYGKGDVIGAYIKDGRISGLKWVLSILDTNTKERDAKLRAWGTTLLEAEEFGRWSWVQKVEEEIRAELSASETDEAKAPEKRASES